MPRRKDDDDDVVRALRQTLTTQAGHNLADALLAIANAVEGLTRALATGDMPYVAQPVEDEVTIQPVPPTPAPAPGTTG